MKKVIYICVGFMFFTKISVAQDVHFSQFSQTPQLINPGATGVFDGSVRGILNYRTQWGAFGNAFNTYGASFDAPITKKSKKGSYLGLGANFYKDVAGNSDFGNLQVGFSVSGVLSIARNQTISLGIQTGYGQYSVNLNSLTWGSQFNGERFDSRINSRESFGLLSSRYFDLSTGMYYEFKNSKAAFFGSDVSSFNVGIAAYHINQPKQTFLNNTVDVLPLKLVAQFSGTFDLKNTKFSLVPSMFYAKQSSYKEFTPGMLFKLRFGNSTKYSGMFKQGAIYFGSHYRVKDALIPQVYLEFSDYMIGVSYDYNTSELSAVTGGSGGLEISIKYVNKPKALQKSSFR